MWDHTFNISWLLHPSIIAWNVEALVMVWEGTNLVEQRQGLTSAAGCGDVTARALRNIQRRKNLKWNIENIVNASHCMKRFVQIQPFQ